MRAYPGAWRLVCVGLCAWGVAQTPRPAQAQAVPLADLGRAASCYNNLNYECVVALLGELPSRYWPEALERPPRGVRALDLPLLVDAGRVLALSYLALGQEAQAQEVFRWLLRLDGAFVLTGSEVPPRFSEIFAQEQAEVFGPRVGGLIGARAGARAAGLGRAGSAPEVALRVDALPPDKEPPHKLPDPSPQGVWETHAGLAWLLPTRADGQTYSAGLGFLAACAWRAPTGWLVGGELGAARHEVTLDDLISTPAPALRWAYAAGLVGGELDLGRASLRVVAGAGLGAFDVGPQRDLSLAALLRGGLRVEVWGPTFFLTHGELRTLSVVAHGGIFTSTLLGATLSLGADL